MVGIPNLGWLRSAVLKPSCPTRWPTAPHGSLATLSSAAHLGCSRLHRRRQHYLGAARHCPLLLRLSYLAVWAAVRRADCCPVISSAASARHCNWHEALTRGLFLLGGGAWAALLSLSLPLDAYRPRALPSAPATPNSLRSRLHQRPGITTKLGAHPFAALRANGWKQYACAGAHPWQPHRCHGWEAVSQCECPRAFAHAVRFAPSGQHTSTASARRRAGMASSSLHPRGASGRHRAGPSPRRPA